MDNDDLNNDDLSSFHNCKYTEIDEVDKELPLTSYAFKAMHFNIRSLNENFHKLQLLLHNLVEKKFDIDFLLLCETFMNDNNSKMFNLSGYTKVENHRKFSRGEG